MSVETYPISFKRNDLRKIGILVYTLSIEPHLQAEYNGI